MNPTTRKTPRRRTRTVPVVGILLRVDGRYVCWQSFTSQWYLGPKRLSEVFAVPSSFHTDVRGEAALALFPTAQVVWAR